jgi:hypothetical protein
LWIAAGVGSGDVLDVSISRRETLADGIGARPSTQGHMSMFTQARLCPAMLDLQLQIARATALSAVPLA